MGYLRRAAARSSSTLVVDDCAGWVDCTGREALLVDAPDEEDVVEVLDETGAAGADAGAAVVVEAGADVALVEREVFLPVPV